MLDWVRTPSLLQTLLLGSLVLALISTCLLAWRYRRAIRKKLDQMDASTFFGKNSKDPFRLVRDKSLKSDRPISFVDLSPDFVQKYADSCRMISLGEYFGTLRPSIVGDKLPEWLESELQAALGLALLRALGPTMGRALLPGTTFLDSVTGRIAHLMTSLWNTNDQKDHENLEDFVGDQSGLPLTLYNIMFLTEMNYQRNRRVKAKAQGPTPWQALCQGEVGYRVSFAGSSQAERDQQSDDTPTDLVPNPFHFVNDWHKTIQAMEDQLIGMEEEPHYDPHSKKLPAPKPIDDRVLPDLCTGYGDTLCTHTQREILYNRLLSVLLNRLSSNYLADNGQEEFVVGLEDGREIRKTEDLVSAIIDMGHQVEVVVTSHVTTFGLGLCLREEDGTFTQIPLAAMVENGYADKKDRKAYTALPHGGLNLMIHGPLLRNVHIQHFISIEGLCAWASNHNADVPWIRDVECGERLKGRQAIPAVRLAAMQTLIISTVGAQLGLPHGGYGLTGVCNDTAAWLEQSIFGSTHVYPITFSGRFAIHMIRRARELEARFRHIPGFSKEVEAIRQLIIALTKLPSDMTNLPSGVVDQCQRQLHCMHPERPFQMMYRTESILKDVMKEITTATSSC